MRRGKRASGSGPGSTRSRTTATSPDTRQVTGSIVIGCHGQTDGSGIGRNLATEAVPHDHLPARGAGAERAVEARRIHGHGMRADPASSEASGLTRGALCGIAHGSSRVAAARTRVCTTAIGRTGIAPARTAIGHGTRVAAGTSICASAIGSRPGVRGGGSGAVDHIERVDVSVAVVVDTIVADLGDRTDRSRTRIPGSARARARSALAPIHRTREIRVPAERSAGGVRVAGVVDPRERPVDRTIVRHAIAVVVDAVTDFVRAVTGHRIAMEGAVGRVAVVRTGRDASAESGRAGCAGRRIPTTVEADMIRPVAVLVDTVVVQRGAAVLGNRQDLTGARGVIPHAISADLNAGHTPRPDADLRPVACVAVLPQTIIDGAIAVIVDAVAGLRRGHARHCVTIAVIRCRVADPCAGALTGTHGDIARRADVGIATTGSRSSRIQRNRLRDLGAAGTAVQPMAGGVAELEPRETDASSRVAVPPLVRRTRRRRVCGSLHKSGGWRTRCIGRASSPGEGRGIALLRPSAHAVGDFAGRTGVPRSVQEICSRSAHVPRHAAGARQDGHHGHREERVQVTDLLHPCLQSAIVSARPLLLFHLVQIAHPKADCSALSALR